MISFNLKRGSRAEAFLDHSPGASQPLAVHVLAEGGAPLAARFASRGLSEEAQWADEHVAVLQNSVQSSIHYSCQPLQKFLRP